MALVCAVEPSPFSVPVEHLAAAVAALLPPELAPALLAPEEEELLLDDDDPHAARATVLAKAPASTAARVSFTMGSPSLY